MSKDFPNRADWLARRSTPAKLPGRYIHVSKPLMTVKTATGFETIVSPAPGSTLNVGSKQRKRTALAAKKARKAERRAFNRLSIDARYETHLTACADFDAEKIAQEAA
jgi:hypothetical protein